MLYLNDELVKFTPDMKKQVLDAVKKFPVVLKMPESFYTKSKDNPKPDRPQYATIPLVAQKGSNDAGSETWHYCTRRDKVKDAWQYWYMGQGNKSNRFVFVDKIELKEKDCDLLWFLLFKSPLREIPGETDAQREARGVSLYQRFQFVVEDKETEAAVKISKRQMRKSVENAILDQFEIDDLRKVGSAMGINNTDGKEKLELQQELLDVVERMEVQSRNGYEKFIAISKLDVDTEIRSSIQLALDREVIALDDKTDTYVYLKKDGKKGKKITGIIGGRTIRESLEHHLKINPNELDELKMAVEEKQLELAT